MILKEIITFNYKSAQEIVFKIQDNTPSIFIGENDCGKTTALNSIKLLLEHGSIVNIPNDKSEKSDLSHSALSKKEINNKIMILGLKPIFSESDSDINSNDIIVVIGRFLIEGFEVNNNEISSHLKWTIDSSEKTDGYKFIYKARTFDTKSNTSNLYYFSKFPENDELKNIFSLTQAQISAAMKQYNPENLNLHNDNSDGRYSNYEKIRSILETVECKERFSLFSDDSKNKKWKTDLMVFPDYAYLSWNESLAGINKAANIILESSIEVEVKRAERIASLLKKRAQNKINAKLSGLGIQSEVSSIEEIKANINFELKNQLSDLFVKKENSEGLVHIENQGEGIKRQIWFGLLKIQAEQKSGSENNKRYIWCFDEPETHLHPKAQREFIETIRKLTENNFQIIISTHSTIFVNSSRLEDIRTFSIKNKYTSLGMADNVTDAFNALGLLNSDFLFYNKFLIVEGNTEETLIPELYLKYTNRTLKKDNIQLLNLKGCNNFTLAQDILDSLVNGFAKTEDLIISLFDADTLKTPNKSLFIIGRQDLEDSLPNIIWGKITHDVFKGKINLTDEEVDYIIKNIPTTKHEPKLDKNKKFAPKLKSLIQRKLDEKNLSELIGDWPNKSHEWGFIIAKYLEKQDIPEPIKNAFDALNSP